MRRAKPPGARSPSAWPRASIQTAPPSGREHAERDVEGAVGARRRPAPGARGRGAPARRAPAPAAVGATPPPPQPSITPVMSDMNSSPATRSHSQMPQRAASTARRKRSSESASALAAPSARSPWITSSTARIAANTIGVNSTLADTPGVSRMRIAAKPVCDRQDDQRRQDGERRSAAPAAPRAAAPGPAPLRGPGRRLRAPGRWPLPSAPFGPRKSGRESVCSRESYWSVTASSPAPSRLRPDSPASSRLLRRSGPLKVRVVPPPPVGAEIAVAADKGPRVSITAATLRIISAAVTGLVQNSLAPASRAASTRFFSEWAVSMITGTYGAGLSGSLRRLAQEGDAVLFAHHIIQHHDVDGVVAQPVQRLGRLLGLEHMHRAKAAQDGLDDVQHVDVVVHDQESDLLQRNGQARSARLATFRAVRPSALEASSKTFFDKPGESGDALQLGAHQRAELRLVAGPLAERLDQPGGDAAG